MKLILVIYLMTTIFISAKEAVDPWKGMDRTMVIKLGHDDTFDDSNIKIKIDLLNPLVITGSGGAGVVDLDSWRIDASDHSFVYTSAGDLFIDHMYAGKFNKSHKLTYGFGRLWSNGKPCTLSKLTASQRKSIYIDTFYKQEDGMELIANKPWSIRIKPIMNSGSSSVEPGNYSYSNGMTMIRITEGNFYLQGFCYGRVKKGANIEVNEGIVKINGKILSPIPIKMPNKSQ